MKDITLLIEKLGDAEYRHLLLEPILIYGVLLGRFGFVFAFLFKERKMQLVALIVIIFSSLMVVPYLNARSAADKRAERLFVAQAEQISEQRETRKDAQWAYFLVAGLAGVTLLMGPHKGKPGLLVGIATVVAGAGLVLFSASMHLKDSRVYHPNLRAPTPLASGGQGDREASDLTARPRYASRSLDE